MTTQSGSLTPSVTQWVAALSDHHAAGRLKLSELEDRVAAAYQSVTRADLDRLLVDLPPRPQPAPRPREGTYGCAASGPSWRAWALAGLVCLTVWALTSIGRSEMTYFWPGWVIGPWGLDMAAQKLTDEQVGGGSGDANGARR